MITKTLQAAAAATVALGFLSAHAAVTTETDRATFEAGIGISSTEDFEGIAGWPGPGGVDTFATVSAGDLTFSTVVDQSGGDVARLGADFFGPGANTNSLAANFFADVLIIDIAPGVDAIGFDLNSIGGLGTDAVISVFNSANDLLDTVTVSALDGFQFIGIIAMEDIARLTIDDDLVSGTTVVVDNFVLGVSGAAPVPVPAAAPLMLAGLGLFAAKRRRKNAA